MSHEGKREPGTEAGPQPGRDRELFSHLLASKPPREGKAAAFATLTSVVFHAVVIGGLVWATLAIGQEVKEEDEVVQLIPIQEEPPPPPPPPPPPMQQAPPPEQVLEDVPKGFQTLAPPEIIPPDIPPPSSFQVNEADFSGEGVEGGRATGKPVEGEVDISEAPVFTPYTVRPELKNRDAVARALERYYPPLLRDAGIGGTVVVWFFIDENGVVRKFQIKQSSGHKALDDAALRVADIMQFSPAMNMDKRVPVWIEIPITFTTRN